MQRDGKRAGTGGASCASSAWPLAVRHEPAPAGGSTTASAPAPSRGTLGRSCSHVASLLRGRIHAGRPADAATDRSVRGKASTIQSAVDRPPQPDGLQPLQGVWAGNMLGLRMLACMTAGAIPRLKTLADFPCGLDHWFRWSKACESNLCHAGSRADADRMRGFDPPRGALLRQSLPCRQNLYEGVQQLLAAAHTARSVNGGWGRGLQRPAPTGSSVPNGRPLFTVCCKARSGRTTRLSQPLSPPFVPHALLLPTVGRPPHRQDE